MLQHEPQEEFAVPSASLPVAQIRVTAGELAQAINALQARKDEEARRLAGTVAIGQVVEEMRLDATPEEVWAQVQEQRAQHAAEAEAARAAAAQRKALRAAPPHMVPSVPTLPYLQPRPRRQGRGRWLALIGIGWAVYGIAHGGLVHMQTSGRASSHSVPMTTKKDLAHGRPVWASSVQEDYQPAGAVDGNDSTRWSSAFSDPQWIAVDLGKVSPISHVVLSWETAYASAYHIQVSLNGQTWTDVYTTAAGQGGVEQIKFAPKPARFVRMYGTKRASPFGYSLFSFDVYQ